MIASAVTEEVPHMSRPDDQARDDPNFDAGDLSTDNAAEEQARADYDKQVGSDEHQEAVADARDRVELDPQRDPEPER
jgi:hypothetical protein